MINEVTGSGLGFNSAYFQARRADSTEKSAFYKDSSASLADKQVSQEKSRFALPEREKNDTGKSGQTTSQLGQDLSYLRDSLRKPYSQGASLYGQALSGQNLQGGSYAKADFRTSDLSGANLAGADLRGADLSNADLAGADLRGANLTGANFTGANIAGANLSGATGTSYNSSGKLTIDRSIFLPRIDISA
jgi:uncharacterized protein YjbI with pentapeptide repeats